MSSIAYEFLVY